MKVGVRVSSKAVEKQADDIRKKVRLAATRALRRTAQQIKTRAVRLLAKEMGVAQKQIRKSVFVRPVKGEVRVQIVGQGFAMRLAEFVAKGKRQPGSFRKGTGVKAKAWGKAKTYKGSFVAEMDSGHVGVFTRTGKARLGIKELWGPGVATTFASDVLQDMMQDVIDERWQINLNHELRFALR